jgi:hypothetical protein
MGYRRVRKLLGAVMVLVFPAEMLCEVVLQEGKNEVMHLVYQYPIPQFLDVGCEGMGN